jgi:hypothetical protein
MGRSAPSRRVRVPPGDPLSRGAESFPTFTQSGYNKMYELQTKTSRSRRLAHSPAYDFVCSGMLHATFWISSWLPLAHTGAMHLCCFFCHGILFPLLFLLSC